MTFLNWSVRRWWCNHSSLCPSVFAATYVVGLLMCSVSGGDAYVLINKIYVSERGHLNSIVFLIFISQRNWKQIFFLSEALKIAKMRNIAKVLQHLNEQLCKCSSTWPPRNDDEASTQATELFITCTRKNTNPRCSIYTGCLFISDQKSHNSMPSKCFCSQQEFNLVWSIF